jgi:hypothetical protein
MSDVSSETKHLQLEFWTGFAHALDASSFPSLKPWAKSWYAMILR